MASKGSSVPGLPPEIVVINATIQTMDTSHPSAEALAIYGDCIAAVGSNAEIKSLAGSLTRTIDAKQRLVIPGFNDAHVHFLMGGFQLSCVDLRNAKSPQEFTDRIGSFARTLPAGKWILGGEWDHESWPGTPLPTKQLIDGVTPHNPVFISRLDGHMALANSVALRMAKIDSTTKEIEAGKIERDKLGAPTGILKEVAMKLVERLIPEPTFEEKLAAARAATDHAATLGVTSVQDMSTGKDLAVFQKLLERGELKTRIYGMSPLSRWEEVAHPGFVAPFGNDVLRIGGLKAFSDGSLGSSTALFFEPYLNESTNRGLPGPDCFPEGIMLKRVMEADRANFQVIVHAIGDHANEQMLSIFKKAADRNGPRDRRFRIEHAQHLRPSEIARFGPEGIIASMQPYHCADDGRWCEARLGTKRCEGAYAFRALLDAGATLAFGSDWTVAPLDPITGVHAAVTRQTLDGKNVDGWFPAQKLTVEETIRAYTVGSAYAEFTERYKGTLLPGKLADLVMLDQNIFQINPNDIKDTRVDMTIMGGKVVYEKGGAR